MEIYRTAGRLAIRRQCAAVFEENLLRLDLFVLCVQSRRHGQRSNFFHSLEALEDSK